MFGLFKKKNSKNTAKQRLMSVISRDRANVSAEFILRLTTDIISSAIKYVEPDYEKIAVHIERNGNGSCLCAKIPIVFYKELSI